LLYSVHIKWERERYNIISLYHEIWLCNFNKFRSRNSYSVGQGRQYKQHEITNPMK